MHHPVHSSEEAIGDEALEHRRPQTVLPLLARPHRVLSAFIIAGFALIGPMGAAALLDLDVFGRRWFLWWWLADSAVGATIHASTRRFVVWSVYELIADAMHALLLSLPFAAIGWQMSGMQGAILGGAVSIVTLPVMAFVGYRGAILYASEHPPGRIGVLDPDSGLLDLSLIMVPDRDLTLRRIVGSLVAVGVAFAYAAAVALFSPSGLVVLVGEAWILVPLLGVACGRLAAEFVSARRWEQDTGRMMLVRTWRERCQRDS